MTNSPHIDSILDLLEGFCEADNRPLLEPVILTLLQELQTQPDQENLALKKIIRQLTHLLASQADPQQQKILQWLADSAKANHPASTLQALLNQLPIASPTADQSVDQPSADEKALTLNISASLKERLQNTQNQSHNTDNLLQLLITDLENAISLDDPEVMRNVLQRSLHRLLADHKIITRNLNLAILESQSLPEQSTAPNKPALTEQFRKPDELTRLPDEKALEQEFFRERARVERFGHPLSLVLIELDPLENRSGNNATNQAVLFYVNHIFPFKRVYDFVAHLSPTRFGLLLPHADIYDAEASTQRLLNKARHSQNDTSQVEQSGLIPTFSAGLSNFRPGDSYAMLFSRTKNALQDAIEAGGNQLRMETVFTE